MFFSINIINTVFKWVAFFLLIIQSSSYKLIKIFVVGLLTI
jgi:hypothetical protein